MLNEPQAGDTGGEDADAHGSPHTNYIQVTPQEKEAIERVSLPVTLTQSVPPNFPNLCRITQA